MRKYGFEEIHGDLANINNRMVEFHWDEYQEIKRISKNLEGDITKDKALVIIHHNKETRVYQYGKEISEGIKSITFNAGDLPVIEYEKVVH